ncbi:hypothetical protein VTI74DRAFT_313 [Chaetomium olivicolor]
MIRSVGKGRSERTRTACRSKTPQVTESLHHSQPSYPRNVLLLCRRHREVRHETPLGFGRVLAKPDPCLDHRPLALWRRNDVRGLHPTRGPFSPRTPDLLLWHDLERVSTAELDVPRHSREPCLDVHGLDGVAGNVPGLCVGQNAGWTSKVFAPFEGVVLVCRRPRGRGERCHQRQGKRGTGETHGGGDFELRDSQRRIKAQTALQAQMLWRRRRH